MKDPFHVISGLFEAIQNEFNIKEDIESTKLAQMRAERLAYEEELEQQRLQEEEESKGKKKAATAKKPKKKSKKAKIPVVVTEFAMLDVDEDFARIEDGWYEIGGEGRSDLNEGDVSGAAYTLIFREHVFPSFQIDLHEYQRFGRIFAIDYLERPPQPTVYENDFSIRIGMHRCHIPSITFYMICLLVQNLARRALYVEISPSRSKLL